MSSPRTGLYRDPEEQPSASPPISASPARSTVRRGSAAAARKVAEVFSLAGIEIGGLANGCSFGSRYKPVRGELIFRSSRSVAPIILGRTGNFKAN